MKMIGELGAESPKFGSGAAPKEPKSSGFPVLFLGASVKGDVLRVYNNTIIN